MTQKEIDIQVQAIKDVTAKTLAGGKDACLQFLINAGIIKKEEQIG